MQYRRGIGKSKRRGYAGQGEGWCVKGWCQGAAYLRYHAWACARSLIFLHRTAPCACRSLDKIDVGMGYVWHERCAEKLGAAWWCGRSRSVVGAAGATTTWAISSGTPAFFHTSHDHDTAIIDANALTVSV